MAGYGNRGSKGGNRPGGGSAIATQTRSRSLAGEAGVLASRLATTATPLTAPTTAGRAGQLAARGAAAVRSVGSFLGSPAARAAATSAGQALGRGTRAAIDRARADTERTIRAGRSARALARRLGI